jgi:hypothetical protein
VACWQLCFNIITKERFIKLHTYGKKWEINDLFVEIILWNTFFYKQGSENKHDQILNNYKSSILSCGGCPPVDREFISSSNGSSGLIAR